MTSWDNLVLKTNPLGLLWAMFPYKFFKNLHTKLGRISLPSILQLLSHRLLLIVTLLWRNVSTVLRLPLKGLKARFRRDKRAARRGYENACDCFEIMKKRILIQQSALACLSKSVAHILQRELYNMGNTGLLRRKAEMTLLQPHLGDSEEFAFWPTSSVQVTVSQGWRRLPP